MSNSPLSLEMTIKILKNGTYYFPATKHYNNSATSVMCDRCHKINLNACIGFNIYDLCLLCIQDISNVYNPIKVDDSSIMTFMEQEQFQPPIFHGTGGSGTGSIKTMMLQKQFNPRGDDVQTYMMQEQFNPRSFGVCTNMMQGSCRKY